MTRLILCAAFTAAVSAQAPHGANWKQAAQKLYAEGRFEELGRSLNSLSLDRGTDPELFCLMGLVELRQGRLPQAREALERLRRFGEGPAKEKLAARLAEFVDRQEKIEPQRQAIRHALLESDAGQARRLIRALGVSPFQRAVLEIYLDLYAGRFVRVEDQVRRMSKEATGAEAAVLAQLEQDLNQARGAYGRLMAFFHGDLQSQEREALQRAIEVPRDLYLEEIRRRNVSKRDTADFSAKVFALYMQRVGDLLRSCPLDDFALDAAFNLAAFTQKYEDLEALGDRILARKGSLRINVRDPGKNQSAGVGCLVIDARSRELYPAISGAVPSFPGDLEQLMPGVKAWRLPFDKVKEIGQAPKYYLAGGRGLLNHDDGTLFRLNGQQAFGAPYAHYLFSDAFGELASRQVIHNLGRFLAHAVNLPAGKADLVKVKVGGSGIFNAVMAVGAASSAITGDLATSTILTEAATQDRAERNARQEFAHSTLQSWTEAIGSQAMANLFRADFGELESLLAVLQ